MKSGIEEMVASEREIRRMLPLTPDRFIGELQGLALDMMELAERMDQLGLDAFDQTPQVIGHAKAAFDTLYLKTIQMGAGWTLNAAMKEQQKEKEDEE